MSIFQSDKFEEENELLPEDFLIQEFQKYVISYTILLHLISVKLKQCLFIEFNWTKIE